MIGTELGNYRIVDALGKGGMARVYVGEHLLLGRRAAIKILDRRFDDDETIKARFFNEARAVSALKHPSIVEVYDFGHAPDGRAYLVMELLAGEPLGRRMKRGVMPMEHSLVFARHIAGALAVAHEHGVVHRDLKPDNIFIERDPEVDIGERAKVLDFGVAKRPRDDRADHLTKAGVLIGTPAYMSPEQVGGTEVTAQSDIYSLGIVLYRMLTGHLPWLTQDQGELLELHLHSPPTPPTVHAPHVPPALEELVLRCLAKRPADRFASMTDVAAALAAFTRVPTEPLPEAVPLPRATTDGISRPLPLPAPEDTGVDTPAPLPDTEPFAATEPFEGVPDSPTTLRDSAGEASGPVRRQPEPGGHRWTTIAISAAGALLLVALAAWGLRGGSGDDDTARPAADRPAPAARPSPAAAAPEPVIEPAAIIPFDAAPPDAETALPPDAGAAPAVVESSPEPAPSRKPRPGSRRKHKPKPKPSAEPDPARRDFEKPVF